MEGGSACERSERSYAPEPPTIQPPYGSSNLFPAHHQMEARNKEARRDFAVRVTTNRLQMCRKTFRLKGTLRGFKIRICRKERKGKRRKDTDGGGSTPDAWKPVTRRPEGTLQLGPPPTGSGCAVWRAAIPEVQSNCQRSAGLKGGSECERSERSYASGTAHDSNHPTVVRITSRRTIRWKPVTRNATRSAVRANWDCAFPLAGNPAVHQMPVGAFPNCGKPAVFLVTGSHGALLKGKSPSKSPTKSPTNQKKDGTPFTAFRPFPRRFFVCLTESGRPAPWQLHLPQSRHAA